MLRVFLSLLLCISAPAAFSQSYQPIAFDTSTYWTEDYVQYEAGIRCSAEFTFACTGDTIVGTERFSKIQIYTSGYNPVTSESPLCLPMLKITRTLLLREDTVARKVYGQAGNVLIDFNKQPGDTLHYLQYDSFHYPVVDSVTTGPVMGVQRRMQWSQMTLQGIYRTIEGIGANYNFPLIAYGEWGIPAYRLQCFCKGGQLLYTDGTVTTCQRKPRLPLTVTSPVLDRAVFRLAGQQLRIERNDLLPLQLRVRNLAGSTVFSQTLTSTAPVQLDLAPGGYVVQLAGRDATGAFFVVLQ